MKSKIRTNAYLLVLVMLVLSMFWGAGHGRAQTPQQPPTPTTEPGTAPAAEFPSVTQTSELTLSSWNFDNVILFGPYGYAVYDIGLPLHWQMKPGGSLALQVNYLSAHGLISLTPQAGSGLANTVMAASVQVKLNGQSIYETVLTSLGAHTLEISLPGEWPPRSGERDRLEVFFHVYGPCEDVEFSSLEILKESALRINYSPGPLTLDLADYPAPFYQRTFQPSATVIVLPDNPSNGLMETALAIVAGLGSRSNNRVQISSMSTSQWNVQNPIAEHGILIGTPQQNTLIAQLLTDGGAPVVLKTRRMEISVSGLNADASGAPLKYDIQIKNTEGAPAGELSLAARLPEGASQAQCDPECALSEGQALWQVGVLDSGAALDFRLTYTPADGDAATTGLTAELIQNGEAMNVASVEAPAQASSQPASELFFTREGQAVAENDGVIALIASPWKEGKALLLATGLTEEAVGKAGRALASTASFPGMLGQSAMVNWVHPDAAVENVPSSEDITFAELGYEDLTLSGTGLKEIYYQFDLPLGWALTQDAQIRLKYAHSPVLDAEQSAITILYNGTPIASAALTPDTAVDGMLIGSLPPRKSLPGRANTLLIRVTLELPDPCADPESSQAWLRLAADSTLHLAHYDRDLRGYLNMDAWPIPFAARTDLSDVLFSLPEQPAQLETSTAFKLASYLGAASGGDNLHPAAALGDPENIDLGAYHLLAIGRPTRNPLLQRVNRELPQPFTPGTDGLQQQVDNVVFRLPAGLDLGLLQSIPSPWSADRVFLAVTGTSDAGMIQASDFMIDSERNWELKGDLVMLRDGKVTVADSRELTSSGQLTAVSTAAPEVVVVGTATPEIKKMGTPVPGDQSGSTTGNQGEPGPATGPLTYPDRYPFLLPLAIGLGALGIIIIGATIMRQGRKDK